jgi:hypothetical protein
MGRTFGRLASTVENQLSAAYKRGERRRDRALAMLESAQQAAGRLHECSNVALPLHVSRALDEVSGRCDWILIILTPSLFSPCASSE